MKTSLQTATVIPILNRLCERLPFADNDRTRLLAHARSIARSYAQALNPDEPRFPSEVAAASLFMACMNLEKRISMARLSDVLGLEMLGWKTIVADMEKRLNNGPK